MNKIFDFDCSYEILNEIALVYVFGIDSKKYLNSQITIDLYKLKKKNHIICAHCNSNGKVYSILRLFYYNHGYLYLQDNSNCIQQLRELKKYSIFSKITINILHDHIIIGVIGKDARKKLLLYFSILPNKKNSVILVDKIIILWFQDPIERFLIICKKNEYIKINDFFFKKKIILINKRWLFLDIQAGIPIINNCTFNQFFPKELNLDTLNGIDFNKGCYLGQEIISKIHFKKLNKKRMYCLIGISYCIIKNFSIIESYNGKDWKKIGKIFFIYSISKNIFVIQSILNIKNKHKNIFRLCNNKKSFFFPL